MSEQHVSAVVVAVAVVVVVVVVVVAVVAVVQIIVAVAAALPLALIYYLSPCLHRFRVSQFFCSCSHHLEFPSLGYSKQFYHILFSSPT